MVKFDYTKEKAILFDLTLDKPVEEYALNFLHIWNNAREYPNMFYKVENNSGCDVFVTANPKYEEEVFDYLSQFGDVSKEIISWVTITAQYDFKGWNELFDEDLETDFAINID